MATGERNDERSELNNQPNMMHWRRSRARRSSAQPAYFEALNREFRYQLTVIGTFAQAIVAEEIKDNRFTIKTSTANVKVSWQVTGIRQDAYANKNRIRVEEDKPERERGFLFFLKHSTKPEERSVEWVGSPERIDLLKQRQPKH